VVEPRPIGFLDAYSRAPLLIVRKGFYHRGEINFNCKRTMNRLPAGSPQLLRQLNSAHVLRAIRSHGPISRADLAKTIGLSKPTVNDVVEGLLGDGTVLESEANGAERPLRPGRRARLLRFRADLGHVLGIDIGANKLLVVVADLNGDVVASQRRAVRARERADAAALLKHVQVAASTALASAGTRRPLLQAVGVGTPGVVDPGTGRLSLAPQLGGWEGLPLGRRLQRSFPCPVLVENEVHLSVLAERWRGAALGIDDALFVQAGYGIGGGLLLGGRLYRGANGAAGEIGYLPFTEDWSPRDGLGPFEHAAGGSAYARHGRRAAATRSGRRLLELAGGDVDAIDAEVVFAAAAESNTAAVRIVDTLVRRLAHGIAAASVVVDPRTVIVGGGLSRAGEMLLRPLERELADLVPIPPRVVLSDLGEEAVALGAIRLAVQTVENRLFGIAAEAV
jgi:predicted NBD/HSP70 family sugar kinase